MKSVPCRLAVLLARQAPRAVILRRGPAAWVELILWDTRNDRFERGQWFRGRVYADRCDLSPDGTKFIYFAAKFGRLAKFAERRKGDIPESWTAISRPPYFTALALWPHGSTWGGGGLFQDDIHFWNFDWYEMHSEFSLGPLRQAPLLETAGIDFDVIWKGERLAFRLARDGWEIVERSRKRAVRLAKRHPRRKHVLMVDLSPRKPAYELRIAGGKDPQALAADWADWDQRGRLVIARDGRIWAGVFNRHKPLRFEELADFNGDRPERREAPAWAARW